MSEDWEPVVAFDVDSEEFTRGVEVGMMFARICAEELPVMGIVHCSNAEMMLRLASSLGVFVRSEELGAEMMAVIFSEAPIDPERDLI